MDKLPVHMRITGLAVSNDDVNSRRSAIKDLSSKWAKTADAKIFVAKAAEIADALGGDSTPPASLAAEVELAIQQYASAFLASERFLEIGVCAGMAVVSLMSGKVGNTGWTSADIYSYALWSALSFQPVLSDQKREDLRRDVLTSARERSRDSADAARARDSVPAVRELEVTIAEDGKASTNFKAAVQGTINALLRNAALDREELDFLWWGQLNHSRLLERPLTEIPEPVRLVASGIEGAGLLRRLPGDIHKEIVLRSVQSDPEISLSELIDLIGVDREALLADLPEHAIVEAPAVYPLLNALIAGGADDSISDVRYKSSVWGARALLEAALANISTNGIGKL